MYSVIETAKLNGHNPSKYLKTLFERIPYAFPRMIGLPSSLGTSLTNRGRIDSYEGTDRGCIEQTGQGWAKGMIELLVGMKDEVEKCREQGEEGLPAYLNRKLSIAYDELVNEGLKEKPD